MADLDWVQVQVLVICRRRVVTLDVGLGPECIHDSLQERYQAVGRWPGCGMEVWFGDNLGTS